MEFERSCIFLTLTCGLKELWRIKIKIWFLNDKSTQEGEEMSPFGYFTPIRQVYIDHVTFHFLHQWRAHLCMKSLFSRSSFYLSISLLATHVKESLTEFLDEIDQHYWTPTRVNKRMNLTTLVHWVSLFDQVDLTIAWLESILQLTIGLIERPKFDCRKVDQTELTNVEFMIFWLLWPVLTCWRLTRFDWYFDIDYWHRF